MSRYWRIYRTFFSSSLARELEFRANFFAKIAQNVVWMFFFVGVLLVIYRNTQTVAGWNRGDAFILAATCFLMNAIVSALFLSLQEVPEQVRKGTLDYVITKPVDTQFWISTRKFNFDQVGTLVAGCLMVAFGLATAGVHPSGLQWIAYVTLVLCSLAIFYSFYLILMTFGIWLVRVDNLWVLGDTVIQVARFPMDIYGPNIQRALTFAVPLAFLATIPAKQLIRSADWRMVGLGVLWAVMFVGISRWFWRFALKHYSSASS